MRAVVESLRLLVQEDFEIEIEPKPIETQDRNGVVVIPVHGTLLNGATDTDRFFGFVGHEEIAGVLDHAVSSGPKGIVLDFKCPGGTVCGTPELARVVERANNSVPVISHTSDVRASAAEFISDGALMITATESAIVGSIGTIAQHVDISRFLDQVGVKVEQFSSGEFKGMGEPAIPLTDNQRDLIRQRVDDSALEFQAHVLESPARDVQDADVFEGQIFSGKQGLRNGLVNMLVENLDGAVDILS